MKKLFKSHTIKLCDICSKKLTAEEKAFNETLCNSCQRKVNAKMHKIFSKIICSGIFPKNF